MLFEYVSDGKNKYKLIVGALNNKKFRFDLIGVGDVNSRDSVFSNIPYGDLKRLSEELSQLVADHALSEFKSGDIIRSGDYVRYVKDGCAYLMSGDFVGPLSHVHKGWTVIGTINENA